MEKRYRKSVLPIYLFGASWVVYAVLFPLYRGIHFILAIALSFAVYFISSKVIPPEEVMVEKSLIGLTGNERVDALITEANSYIKQIRQVNAGIADEGVSEKISEIEQITLKICEYVKQHPDGISGIRRFITYYLPTTLKLLTTYSELASQDASTPNISGTMKKVDDMLDTVIGAFNKQLDSLYEYKAMDVSAEISVMENILSGEGLLDKEQEMKGSDITKDVRDFQSAEEESGIALTLDTGEKK